MKALRYHFLLTGMAVGILFVLFNLMPNEDRIDVADSLENPVDSLSVVVPVGVGQGFGVSATY
ncbi:MAG: hypothetical protein HKN13_05620 [Rhodothermales bacterium]|nr:hypothetical protein [Rhodothermales bacterium]